MIRNLFDTPFDITRVSVILESVSFSTYYNMDTQVPFINCLTRLWIAGTNNERFDLPQQVTHISKQL